MSCTPAGDVLPALPPIRTRAAVADPAPDHASASTTTVPEAEPLPAPAVAEEEVVAESRTPAAVAEEEVVAESRTPAAVAEEGEEEEEAEPKTPTSEESKLRPPTECPGAPRKPVASVGTRPSPKRPVRYFDVPRDLSAVFMSLPPKKRIRAPPCLVAFRPSCGTAWGHGSAL